MKFLALLVAGLEWYDNAICFAMTDILSNLFFPTSDPNLRFLLYLSSFIAGYLGRPLGAVLFGWYSDKKCRVKAAYASLAMMVIASLSVSFLPIYKDIGFVAPLCFVILRFLQGIALGGNYAISVFGVEQADYDKKYFTSSIISCGFISGFLFGGLITSGLNKFLSREYLLQEGWRYPFWLGFIVALPILYQFKKLNDEYQKEEYKKKEKENLNLSSLFQVFVLLMLDMVPFYIFFVFLPNYMVMFEQADSAFIWFKNSVSMFTMLILTPFAGKLADKYGGVNLLKWISLAIIAIAYFSPWKHWIWCVVFGATMAGCYGALYAFIAMIFPKNVRARASGITYNIASVVIGAGTPMIATILAKHNFQLVAVFLGLISLIVFLQLNFVKETNYEI